MLLSTVVKLKALENGSLPMNVSAAIRSEFLERWVGEVDAELGTKLHSGEPDKKFRPYTVSDLNGSFERTSGFHIVRSGQEAWFRITSLEKPLSFLLQNSILPNIQGRVIELDRARFQVQEVRESPHEWTGKSSYQELWEHAFKQSENLLNTLDIDFSSPTTFKVGQIYLPLPFPENVFGSWLERWNEHADQDHKLTKKGEISAELKKLYLNKEDLKNARLAITRYDSLTTQDVEINRVASTSLTGVRKTNHKKGTRDGKETESIPLIGFQGTVRFSILSSEEYWIRVCNLLARFAFYCGTGAKTTFGMGQTRGLNELDWKNSRPR